MDAERPSAARITAGAARAAGEVLRTVAERVVQQVRAAARVVKTYDLDQDDLTKVKRPPRASVPPLDPVDPVSVESVDLDLGDLSDLENDFADALEAASVDASLELLGQVGLDDDQDIVDQVSERAVAAAREQAGELISNVNDSTRGMIRDEIAAALEDNVGLGELADRISESAAFGEDRALLIASTEVRNANERGVLEGLRGARSAGNNVKKEWLLGANPCEVCQENADVGPIDLDEEFPSGDTEPTAHPWCECALTGLIGEDETDQADEVVADDTGADVVEALYRISKGYSPDQSRDDRGRWTSGASEIIDRAREFIAGKSSLGVLRGVAEEYHLREVGVEALSLTIQGLVNHATGLDPSTWNLTHEAVDRAVRNFAGVAGIGAARARDALRASVDKLTSLRLEKAVDDVMSLLEAVATALDRWRDVGKGYDPDQPRDERGRFGSGGGPTKPTLAGLFSNSFGVERADMPQVPSRFKDKFVEELRADGVGVTRETVDARSLRPAQRNFNADEIERVRAGFASGVLKSNPIVISSDDYVLDGHHRWAVKAQDGEDIGVVRVGLPIGELIDRAREFNDRLGIEAKKATMKVALDRVGIFVKDFNPDQPRDAHGRFAAGGGEPGTRVDIRASMSRDSGASQSQPVKDLDELYDRAKAEERGFKDAVESSARAVGGSVAYTPPEFAEPGTTLKSRASAERKARDEYGGDASKLRDVLRATVVGDTIEQARRAAADFIEKNGENVLRVKDRFVESMSGYRDILINYRTPGGLVAEIQFNGKDMLAAKNGEGHRIYERLRAPGLDVRAVIALKTRSESVYGSAYRRDGDGNWGKS